MQKRNGLVAQLGAHHIRIVGVEGSNPFKSTNKKVTFTGDFLYRLSKKLSLRASARTGVAPQGHFHRAQSPKFFAQLSMVFTSI